MPRWKSTANILTDHREVFDANWMDRDTLQTPPRPAWTGANPPCVEDVDIWEVITEMSGPRGVYAAWCPYADLFIVTDQASIVAEFSGLAANERLEAYLIAHQIPYPKG